MMIPLPEELLSALLRLGFSQYEAQAYCALLRQSPANGHEVGKQSGVPPSKIYETLQRLESKGAVLVHRSEPVRYAAVPYREVLTSLQRKFEADLSLVDQRLATLPVQREPGLVWSLRQRGAILTAFAAALDGAKSSLFVAVWDEEIDTLRSGLERASQRGVDTRVAIYGSATLSGPRCYDLRDCGRSAQARLGGRRLSVVVADERDTLLAEFGPQASDEAVVTDNTVISLLAVEYVKADVMGRLLINAMGAEAYETVRASAEMQALLTPSPPA
jgi:sugar-specific transcriptional regulator TrmB